MRIAFLADIHSNLPALEAVLGDLQTQAPDAVYLVGDQVNRCPWPNEVMDLLTALGWSAIYGNHDLVVGRLNTAETRSDFGDRNRFPCLWWTAEVLTPAHLQTLRALPAELRLDLPAGPPIRLLHGIPGNPFVGFYPEASDEEVATQIKPVAEPVIVSGHTHRPLARQVGRQWLFNGGSVGMAYNDDPRAQYLILDAESKGGMPVWRPTFRCVAYDQSGFPAAFSGSGMMAALGPWGVLHLRTALTGHAYSSDFGYWLRFQPDAVREDMERAVTVYLEQHGPGRWAFWA